MHEVRAEPLDHRTRSAGIETGEVGQRTSHSPRLRVCSTWYGSGTAAPSGSHLPQGRHPPKRFLVVEAPCSGPSDAGLQRGGGIAKGGGLQRGGDYKGGGGLQRGGEYKGGGITKGGGTRGVAPPAAVGSVQ